MGRIIDAEKKLKFLITWSGKWKIIVILQLIAFSKPETIATTTTKMLKRAGWYAARRQHVTTNYGRITKE